MHLHDAQQYANDYESCIAGSEELFIDFLGGDIAGGLLCVPLRSDSSCR